jgi:hypothetical protein
MSFTSAALANATSVAVPVNPELADLAASAAFVRSEIWLRS